EVAGKAGPLTVAAAKAYFKLLAYKDEYEVARLHTRSEFLEDLREHFGSASKLRFHFSPPLFASIDPETGRPKKYEFGGWVLPVLRLLASLKWMRGKWLDPFARSRDRRLERELIVEYEQLLDGIVAGLDAHKLDLAIDILGLAESIKGYGPIKERSVAKYREQLSKLLSSWEASTPSQPRSPEPAQATAA
ncbi:MAG TPA: DUF6537 domain-containing protein, partial [Gammaproteobacteria bacterium]